MSAKVCNRCGRLCVFAKDRATDQWMALTNQAPVWRIVASRNGVPYVVRETKLLSTHYCTQAEQPPAEMPSPDINYCEPKEPLIP